MKTRRALTKTASKRQ